MSEEVIHASQGYVDKTARQVASEEIAKVVANAPQDLDTLKEIADYIENDKTGAAQMATQISANADAIIAEENRAKDAESVLRNSIRKKVDAEDGKGLSTNDFANDDKAKLGSIEYGAQKNPDLSGYAKKSDIPSLDGYAKTDEIESAVDNKVNAVINDKANLSAIAHEYSVTSAYTVGEIVYYNGNIYQCKTEIAEGGEAWNAEHWELMKLDNFFTNSNSLLTGTIDARLPYQFYDVTQGGFLKDRAINMVTESIGTVIVPENVTDLIIRASVSWSLAVAFHDSITTKYGDTFPSEAGEYLITITKIGASEVYVRTIKLEVAQ